MTAPRTTYWVHTFELHDGTPSVTLLGPNGIVPSVDRFMVYGHSVQWSPNTLRSYARDLKDWFEFLNQRDLSWDAVPVQILPDWIEWLRFGDHRPTTRPLIPIELPERLSVGTINHKLSAVHMFYRSHPETRFADTVSKLVNSRAETAAHLRRSPFHLREPDQLIRALTHSELDAVRQACETPLDQFIVGCMADRGMRIGQILGFRHEDISVQRLEYAIVPRNNNVNGARSKTRRTHHLPLTKTLARTYTRYLLDQYGTIDSDYVVLNFNGPRCHEPMRYDDTRPHLHRLQQRSGVIFSWHTLRHTFATHAIARGVALSTVQEMLCHRDPKTTSGTYLHLRPDDLRSLLGDVIVDTAAPS